MNADSKLKKNPMFYFRYTISLSFILLIILSAFSASGDEDDTLTWVTTKDAAVEKALSEGKYILLFAGQTGCTNCIIMMAMCNYPPIKQVLLENYVTWYCNVNESTEHYTYVTPYLTCSGGSCNFTTPVICRIDPRDPDVSIDGGSGTTDSTTFYNFLVNGLGDLDSDGMPDEWERQYGLNALINDADEDADGDSFSNLNEYLKGTDPSDAKSHPPRFMPWLPLLLEGE